MYYQYLEFGCIIQLIALQSHSQFTRPFPFLERVGLTGEISLEQRCFTGCCIVSTAEDLTPMQVAIWPCLRGQTTPVPSTVVSAKATDTLGSDIPGKDLSAVKLWRK